MLLRIFQEVIRAGRQYAYPVSRGLANIEKPAFDYAYKGQRLSRLKKPIYRGYKAGTAVGLAGDAILDALLSEIQESAPGTLSEKRKYMVKPGGKRFRYKKRCPPRYRR